MLVSLSPVAFIFTITFLVSSTFFHPIQCSSFTANGLLPIPHPTPEICPICTVNPSDHRTLCEHDLCLNCFYTFLDIDITTCNICSSDLSQTIFNVISLKDLVQLPFFLRQCHNTIDGYTTPLHAAVMISWTEGVAMLAPYSLLSAQDKIGKTVLNCAINQAGADLTLNLDIIRLLIENGAPLEEEDDNGCTPMAMAVYIGRLDVVKLLIEKDCPCDVVAINSIGNSLLDIADEALTLSLKEGQTVIDRYTEVLRFLESMIQA